MSFLSATLHSHNVSGYFLKTNSSLKSILVLLLVLVYLPSFSQSRTITGVVKSKVDNEALAGAKVMGKGTKVKSELILTAILKLQSRTP